MAIHLTDPHHSYFFGFVQGDGHLYRQKGHPNKGRLSVELSVRDQDILFRFKDMFPDSSIRYRERDTNFRDDYVCAIWTLCGQAFREEIELLGLPVGSKSLIIEPPKTEHCPIDYWRGIIDADGSLGLTSAGLPFVSLVTTSQMLADAYEAFLFSIIGKHKILNRNKRDRAFNIMIVREDAVKVAKVLYYDGCLALDRKKGKARDVVGWVRPAGMRINSSIGAWTSEQDSVIMTVSVKEACRLLRRTKASVTARKTRLKRAIALDIRESS